MTEIVGKATFEYRTPSGYDVPMKRAVCEMAYVCEADEALKFATRAMDQAQSVVLTAVGLQQRIEDYGQPADPALTEKPGDPPRTRRTRRSAAEMAAASDAATGTTTPSDRPVGIVEARAEAKPDPFLGGSAAPQPVPAEADMAALGRWTRTKPSDDANLPPLEPGPVAPSAAVISDTFIQQTIEKRLRATEHLGDLRPVLHALVYEMAGLPPKNIYDLDQADRPAFLARLAELVP
jgi:hypothetical protein